MITAAQKEGYYFAILDNQTWTEITGINVQNLPITVKGEDGVSYVISKGNDSKSGTWRLSSDTKGDLISKTEFFEMVVTSTKYSVVNSQGQIYNYTGDKINYKYRGQDFDATTKKWVPHDYLTYVDRSIYSTGDDPIGLAYLVYESEGSCNFVFHEGENTATLYACTENARATVYADKIIFTLNNKNQIINVEKTDLTGGRINIPFNY